MANDDIQDKRLRARLALEGEERHTKREQSEAELLKMRQEAMLAMEGAERKAAREAKLKAEQDHVENEKKRLAEIEHLRQLETERKAAEAEKARLETEKQAQTKEAQLEKIHQAEAKIETIKQAPALSISSVRTLQSDLAQAVERRNMSATSIAVKNQESPKNISFADEPKSSPLKTILTATLIIVLVGAGAGAIWYVQKINSNQGGLIANLDLPKLITAENTEVINMASTTPASQIKTELRAKLADAKNGITNFYFTTQIVDPENPEELKTIFTTPADFSRLSAVFVPDGVLRSVGETFTLGVLNNPNVRAPFIILQIKPGSTDLALARMFSWEETMPENLADLWAAKPKTAVELPTETSTTSPATEIEEITLNKSFVDKRINNLDTRVLYYSDQSPALLYTFFNNKYIVITTDDRALADLIARLAP